MNNFSQSIRHTSFRIVHLRPLLVALLLLLVSSEGWAQEADQPRSEGDSLAVAQAQRSVWISEPSSGKTRRIAGGVMMALGGLNIVAGRINQEREDPCADANSRYVTCVSNVEDVRTVGTIQLVVGTAAVFTGLLLYLNGRRKGKQYDEWKQSHAAVQPVMRHDASGLTAGIRVSL